MVYIFLSLKNFTQPSNLFPCPQLKMQSESHHVQALVSAEQPHMRGSIDMLSGMIPIIEISFGQGMWWSLPQEMSAAIYEEFEAGQDAGYTWDWGKTKAGTFRLNDEPTSINRYTIDFNAMEQTNLDTRNKRTVRIVWTTPVDTQTQSWGEVAESMSVWAHNASVTVLHVLSILYSLTSFRCMWKLSSLNCSR